MMQLPTFVRLQTNSYLPWWSGQRESLISLNSHLMTRSSFSVQVWLSTYEINTVTWQSTVNQRQIMNVAVLQSISERVTQLYLYSTLHATSASFWKRFHCEWFHLKKSWNAFRWYHYSPVFDCVSFVRVEWAPDCLVLPSLYRFERWSSTGLWAPTRQCTQRRSWSHFRQVYLICWFRSTYSNMN